MLLEVCQRRSDGRVAEQGNEQVEAFTSVTNRPVDAPSISDDTTHAIDRVMTKGGRDPRAGDELFVAGLRLLLTNLSDRADA